MEPTLGRFVQRDPLGYINSLNTYDYILTNPHNGVDPLGLSKWPPENPPVGPYLYPPRGVPGSIPSPPYSPGTILPIPQHGGRPAQSHSRCSDQMAVHACKVDCSRTIHFTIDSTIDIMYMRANSIYQSCVSRASNAHGVGTLRYELAVAWCRVVRARDKAAVAALGQYLNAQAFASIAKCQAGCEMEHQYYVFDAPCPDNWETIVPHLGPSPTGCGWPNGPHGPPYAPPPYQYPYQ